VITNGCQADGRRKNADFVDRKAGRDYCIHPISDVAL
jgi:hypothetical protein